MRHTCLVYLRLYLGINRTRLLPSLLTTCKTKVTSSSTTKTRTTTSGTTTSTMTSTTTTSSTSSSGQNSVRTGHNYLAGLFSPVNICTLSHILILTCLICICNKKQRESEREISNRKRRRRESSCRPSLLKWKLELLVLHALSLPRAFYAVPFWVVLGSPYRSL